LKARRGEDEVSKQQIDGLFMLCADFEGLGAAVGNEDRKACLLKYFLAQLRDGRLVIDHQDGGRLGLRHNVLLS
jgi:hypothetical protein